MKWNRIVDVKYRWMPRWERILNHRVREQNTGKLFDIYPMTSFRHKPTLVMLQKENRFCKSFIRQEGNGSAGDVVYLQAYSVTVPLFMPQGFDLQQGQGNWIHLMRWVFICCVFDVVSVEGSGFYNKSTLEGASCPRVLPKLNTAFRSPHSACHRHDIKGYTCIYYSVRKVYELFLLKPGGFQWNSLEWGELDSSYECVNFFPSANSFSWWQAAFEWGRV